MKQSAMRPRPIQPVATRPGSRRFSWLGLLVAAVVASTLALPVVSAADRAELEAELATRYKAIELREGFLFEPLPDFEDLPVVEISDGELWVDGAPATSRSLGRLGDLEAAVRELAEEEGVDLGALGSGPAGNLAPLAPPAPPAPPEARPRKVHKDDQIVVGGSLVVEEDEITRDVVVMGGSLTILGRVNGDAAVIGGSADIQGEVNGDVAIVGGTVKIGPEARIRGDVETVGGAVELDDNAVVEGEVNEVSFGAGMRIGRWVESYARNVQKGGDGPVEDEVDVRIEREVRIPAPARAGARLAGRLFGFLFLCLISALVLLFLRGPVERMADQVRSEPAKCGLVGLVAQILFFPLLLVTLTVLVVSVIGIPLLVLVPFLLIGCVLLIFVGFVSAALEIGRFLKRRFDLRIESVFALLILGLFVIEVWSLAGGLFGAMGRFMAFFAGMFTVFGLLLSYLTVTIGLGAALISRAGTRSAPALPPFAGGSSDPRVAGAGVGGTDWDDDVPPIPPRDSPGAPDLSASPPPERED